MNGQNEHLLNWLTPIDEEETKTAPPSIQQGASTNLQQWLTPISVSGELRAEKPDIKTRLRMANIEGQQLSRRMLEPFGYKEKTSLGRIGEAGFWKNLLQNMGVQSREFIQGIPQLAESLQCLTPRGVATQAMQPPRYKSVLEPRGYKPPKERTKLGEFPALESLKTAGELLIYMPKAGMEFMRDPVKFIEERPVDTLFLIEAIGVRPAIKMRQRLKSGKSLHGRDIQHVIDKVPDDIIPKEVKETVRKNIPKEKEIPGKRQLEIQKKLGEKFPPPKDPLKEYHAGYPLGEEIKKSFEFLRTGRPGGVLVDKTTGAIGTHAKTGEVMKPPPPTKPPKIIRGGEVDLALEPYTTPLAGEPLAIVKQKNYGAMPVYRHEIGPFQRTPVKDIPYGRVKTDFQNSLRIFELYPPLKKTLYDPVNIANTKTFRANQNIQKVVVPGWKKTVSEAGVSPKISTERIANHLTSLQEGGPEILAAMRKKIVSKTDLTGAELSIISESRKMYDGFWTNVNRARELAGQTPLKYEKNYFTWMRNLEGLAKEGISLIEDSAPMVQRHLGGPSFKYAIRRRYYEGKPIDIPVDLDFFKVFEQYAMDANKVINITPIVAKSRAMLEDFKIQTGEAAVTGKLKFGEKPVVWNLAQNTPKLHGWLTRWTDSLIDRSYIPSSPTASLLAKGATTLNKNIGVAILSMNVRSALIQPSAFRNSFIEIGAMRLAEGMIDNLNPSMRNFAMKNSRVLPGRNMDIHVQRILDDAISGKISKTKGAVAKAGMTPLVFLDMETARATWLGAYKKGKAKGLTGNDLIVFADDTVTRTQASGKISDVAQIQKTPLGRLATLFNTFIINEWNFIAQDVMGIKNPRIAPKDTMVKALRLVTATAAVNALFEGVMKVRSPFPAPEWAILHGVQEGKEGKEITIDAFRELGEQLPIFGGTIRYSTPYRTPLPTAAQTLVDATTLVTKILSGRIEDASPYDVETLGKLLGIPGTSQIFKYLRRRKKGLGHAKAIIGVRTDVGTTGGRGRTGRGR